MALHPPHPMEVEITEIPPVSDKERAYVEAHSLLNVINILQGELILLGIHLCDQHDLLHRGQALCHELVEALHEPEDRSQGARLAEGHILAIRTELAEVLARHPEKASAAEVSESLGNLDNVLNMLSLRARETLERLDDPGRWCAYPIAELNQGFREVFAAIEKNSKGRFRIIYNLARQGPQDYYIDFKFEGIGGESIHLPPIFIEVMRDLLANARKYTPLGGCISCGLYQSNQDTVFVVEDSGRGIPPAEIQEVFHFGRRGSNVADVRTYGGGFGLTKAFLITKQFQGRLWVRSEPSQGTRLRIWLPNPPDLLPPALR